ncbi:hypothetical protein D3C83_230900 [compost metagenome]
MKLPIFTAARWRNRITEVKAGTRAHPFAYEMIEMNRDEYRDYVAKKRVRAAHAPAAE